MSEKGMYPDTETWNPFLGCRHDCAYCKNSFQIQVNRVGHNPYVRHGTLNPREGVGGPKGGCLYCKIPWRPHYHPERLCVENIPNTPIVFVFGQGDITFCKPEYVRRTFVVIRNKQASRVKSRNQLYYWQSKDPKCLEQYLDEFPDNSIVVTTLETNRDEGYRLVSQAPLPSQRFKDLFDLDYHKKVVTVEPVLDFDIDELSSWMIELKDQGNLLYVWFGYESKGVDVPNPIIKKSQRFVDVLADSGIEVRAKSLEVSKTWLRRFDDKVKLRKLK